jgi:two-component system, cell cycle response regulator CpdR
VDWFRPDSRGAITGSPSRKTRLNISRYSAAEEDRQEGAMKRILLAEDDNDMRQFLTRALKSAGYEVVSFDNGRSAYERLREEPFSLLLSDIVMPEMDGIELARRATELDPDLKVMFITGFAAVALNPDSEAPRDASVLSKPFHLKDLVSEVERLLAA